MTEDRWLDLINKLEDEGKIEEKITEELGDRPGTVDSVIIKSPLGRLRLSRTSEPKKLSEKAIYSKRGGSTAAVVRSSDEHDIIHRFIVEKEDAAGEWVEIDAKKLGLT